MVKATFAEPSTLLPARFLAVVHLPALVAVDALPDNAAVIVPAVKLPLASLATIALAVFKFVAVVAELETLPAVEIVDSFESAIEPANMALVTLVAPIAVTPPDVIVTSPVTAVLTQVVPEAINKLAAVAVVEPNATPLILATVGFG